MRQLRKLLERRRKLDLQCEQALDALALATLEASEKERASRRQIGLMLEVGSATVQGWIVRGRQVRQRNV